MQRRMDRASGSEGERRGVVRARGFLHSMPRRACVALTSCALAAAVSIGTASPPAALADDNEPNRGSTLLTRMLQEGQSFQVRAGAAALMGQRRDGQLRPELEGALGDSHPSVRAAAANALGRIGSTASLPPLRGAARDRVREVANTAQHAINTIQSHSDVAPMRDPRESSKPRFGLMLGEMVNQSAYVRPEVSRALGVAVQRQLQGVPGVVLFSSERAQDVAAASGRGLTVFRLDGAVTTLSAITTEDGQLSMHCEVALLVVDRPTGSLRTLFKGAARALEIPKGDLDVQRLDIAQRVVAGAVRSALRNADSALAVATH